ncbi:MAG: DUF305 domain-containing protein [Fimbriimonas sp.]
MSPHYFAPLLLGALIGAGTLALVNTAISEPSAGEDQSMASMGHGPNDRSGSMTAELSPLSGEAFDRKFIELMIEHHEGAVEMAELAREKAAHAEIRDMSDDIIEAQTREIEQMKKWKEAWSL